MPLSTTPSIKPGKTVAATDRRIGIVLFFAIIFFLVILSKDMFLRNILNSTAEGNTIQLQWQDGKLTGCRSADCIAKDSPNLLPPDILPFFFEPIPINMADARLIETIDGIGPHMAAEILRLRDEGMIFRNGEDLLRVPGIGLKRLRQLEQQLSFSVAR